MSKKKILIIEDESDQTMMVKARLEANGYEVSSAFDGAEGLNKVQQEKPDLVLLDLILPKMDGFEVFTFLRKDPQTKSIPVIVITAFGTEFAEERCRDCEVEHFIRKPYEAEELVAKIKALLSE